MKKKLLSHDKKNFLISIFSSIGIFALSFVMASFIARKSPMLGYVSFFVILAVGITFFICLMFKYRKP